MRLVVEVIAWGVITGVISILSGVLIAAVIARPVLWLLDKLEPK